ncbi:MAG: DNA-binding protein [Betaproteobacteria bacterium]|nr:DNA-binding protein [Betaproteobacteria bacterium]
MTEFDFLLKFELADPDADAEKFVDALYEAGCDDATVGIGQSGRIALNFTRQAASALEAVSSAIADVRKAVPNAKLIEATPDLVGLTDIAEILGCSRQNIRKLVVGHRSLFPSPIHEGSAAIWHLSKVLQWFKAKGNYAIEDSLIEVSKAAMQVNIARQMQDLEPAFHRNVRALLT